MLMVNTSFPLESVMVYIILNRRHSLQIAASIPGVETRNHYIKNLVKNPPRREGLLPDSIRYERFQVAEEVPFQIFGVEIGILRQ